MISPACNVLTSLLSNRPTLLLLSPISIGGINSTCSSFLGVSWPTRRLGIRGIRGIRAPPNYCVLIHKFPPSQGVPVILARLQISCGAEKGTPLPPCSEHPSSILINLYSIILLPCLILSYSPSLRCRLPLSTFHFSLSLSLFYSKQGLDSSAY